MKDDKDFYNDTNYFPLVQNCLCTHIRNRRQIFVAVTWTTSWLQHPVQTKLSFKKHFDKNIPWKTSLNHLHSLAVPYLKPKWFVIHCTGNSYTEVSERSWPQRWQNEKYSVPSTSTPLQWMQTSFCTEQRRRIVCYLHWRFKISCWQYKTRYCFRNSQATTGHQKPHKAI